MNHYIVGHNERCIGCGTCQAACSDAHKAFGLQAHPRISVIKTSDISVISACHHCEGAPCAEVCPVQVIHHFGNFIYVDEKNCIGCKLCAYICPFGAIHPDGTPISGVAGISMNIPTYSKTISPTLDWEIGVHTVAVKCDVCFFDPNGPNCVRVCPTQAIEFITEEDVNQKSKELRERAAEVLTQVVHDDTSSASTTGGEE